MERDRKVRRERKMEKGKSIRVCVPVCEKHAQQAMPARQVVYRVDALPLAAAFPPFHNRYLPLDQEVCLHSLPQLLDAE